MAIVYSNTCLYCEDRFASIDQQEYTCPPCAKARSLCKSLGEGEVALQWAAFLYGPEVVRRAQLAPEVIRRKIQGHT